MIVYKTFRYRIYPTLAQEQRFAVWETSLRFLWNLAHEQRLLGLSRQRAERKYYTAFDQINQFAELRAELSWLADVPRSVCEQLLIALDRAWRQFFKKLKGRPHWKKKGPALSFTEPRISKCKIKNNIIRFPKIGDLTAVIHRPIEGKAKNCTIKRNGDQWFASILCEIEISPEMKTEPVIAIDRGLANTLADSEGRLTLNPRHYDLKLRLLVRAQRKVNKRKKGSRNREKAKIRVMRIHRKIMRQRRHFLHVESSQLAKSHGTVVIEDLDVIAMIKNKLARNTLNAAWSTFETLLKYKLLWNGGQLIKVPAAYSSQTCSVCGTVDSSSRIGERFCCTKCGHNDHADLNAAKVLLSRANHMVLPAEG